MMNPYEVDARFAHAKEAGRIERFILVDGKWVEKVKEIRGRYLVMEGVCFDPTYVRKVFTRKGKVYSKIIKEKIA